MRDRLTALLAALDFTRYAPNGWALAYWASGALVALHIALILAERREGGDRARIAVALNLGVLDAMVVLAGATLASGDPTQCVGTGRLGVAVAAFLGPAMLGFVDALVERPPARTPRRAAILCTAGGLAAVALFTDGMVAGAWLAPFGRAPLAGPLIVVLVGWVLGFAWVAMTRLVLRIRASADPREKRQLRLVFLAFVVGHIGFTDVLAMAGLPILPNMYLGTLGTALLISYGLREHKLLHAPDFGWRALGWALASALVLAPVLVLLLVTRRWAGWGRPRPTAAALLGLALLVRAWTRWIQPRIDDVFLRRRRDLVRELEALGDRLLVFHTAEAIGRELASLLARTLYVKLCAFAVRDDAGTWRVVHSAWGSVPPPTDDDPFVRALVRRPDLVLRPTLARIFAGPVFAAERQSAERMCTRYGAELILPILAPGAEAGWAVDLLGLVAVGPRADERPFEVMEVELFARVSDAIAAPLAAARLYDRRQRLQRELEEKVAGRTADLGSALAGLESAQTQLVQSEKMATLGLVVAGVAAELEDAVHAVSDTVPQLAAHARAYDEAAGAYLATLPGGAGADEVRAWARRAKLDFVRRDVGPLVEAIGEGARRARAIAADLGRFARADEAVRAPVDLHRELEATLNLLRHDLKERIRVEKRWAEDLPLVECDPGPIGQVFMNLVINAIQAIDGPGTITLTTRLLPGGAQVEVGVRDTGKGIARDHLHRIFEPFFTTKAFGAKGGTGLGLSISYGIVERHGGQILVDSEPGQGTEFRVVLPVKAAPPVTQGSL